MQEFMVDTGDWKTFWERWRDTVAQIPGLKEQMLETIGERIRAEVTNDVEPSGIKDRRGRVKLWQQWFIGSKKGYTAVRAVSEDVPAGYRKRTTGIPMGTMNAGALTNFLVSGHRVRGPSGRAKRYQPRARMTRIKGHDFYTKAQAEAEKIAMQEAEAMLRELKEKLQL